MGVAWISWVYSKSDYVCNFTREFFFFYILHHLLICRFLLELASVSVYDCHHPDHHVHWQLLDLSIGVYYANIFLLLHIVSLLHIDSLSIIFFIIVHLPHDTMIYTNLVRILLFSACCMYLLTVYYYNFLNDENKLNIEHWTINLF